MVTVRGAQSVLVIIPCYNEQATIADVIAQTRSALPQADVLIIDDGSADQTRSAGLAAGAGVVTLPFNLGVGGALRAGFRYAVRHGYRAAVQIDGDGQHDPAEARKLLDGLDHADLVIGARFAAPGGDYRVGKARRAAMVVLAGALTKRSGTTLTDTTSGFRAFGPKALALFAVHYPAEYLGDTVEALLIACQHDLRISQLPVVMRPRQGGVASQSSLKAVAQLARLVPALLIPSAIRHQFSVTEELP